MTTPRGGGDEPSSAAAAAGNDPTTPTHTSGLNRRGSRSAAMATFSMEVFDNEVVPSALNSIAPILRVAAEIDHERPRVAYLCRFYAFEKAHRLDQNSVGRGVRQFKTALLQRLEKIQLNVTMELATPEDYICQASERSMSLTDFRVRNLPRELLLSEDPPDQQPGQYPSRLCPEAQRLFLFMLRMADALVWFDKLPDHITAEKVVLTFPYLKPKLAASVVLQDGLTDVRIRSFMSELRGIFIQLVRHFNAAIPIPPELHALFDLMEQPAIPYHVPDQTKKDLPLMLVHASLMLMQNRGDAFLRMYQFSEDILKWMDSRGYMFLMNEIVHPPNLELAAGQNANLKSIFDRGKYPHGTGAKAIHHIKYNRNGPAHALECAFDPTRPHGLRYTASDLNHANYLISQFLLSTMRLLCIFWDICKCYS